jgi:hypothetical protein
MPVNVHITARCQRVQDVILNPEISGQIPARAWLPAQDEDASFDLRPAVMAAAAPAAGIADSRNAMLQGQN